MSELGNGLLDFPGWGYVIYRTTYSSESDAVFPRTVRYDCIKQGFLTQHARTPVGDAEAICAKLLSTIVEDRNLTGRLSMCDSCSFPGMGGLSRYIRGGC